MSSTPFSVRLNSYMQKRHESHLLTMSETRAGDLWKIEYKVNDVVKGSGSAPQKRAAQELAAQEALRNLGVDV